MKQKSFTLIELLVVIAIIGLLASIILVSFKGTREKARIAKSLDFSQSIQNALGSEAVGIWSFNDCGSDGSVPATLKDVSGYGNNGTNNGAICREDTPHKVIGQGQGKYALSFNGVNDYVDVGNGASLRPTSEITVEAWVKPAVNMTGARYTIVSSHIWGVSGYRLMQELNNAVRFDVAGGAIAALQYGFVLPQNQWTHVVATAKSGTNDHHLYLNGVEVPASKNVVNFVASTVPLKISEGGSSWNGLIDEVRIYNSALTTAEIQKHYAAGLEKHQNLAKE